MIDPAILTLAGITFAAAVVNGGLGYGFSSITMPVALLYFPNRLLNPAMVLIETFVNGYTLIVNRKHVPAVWRRVRPILVGLVPGVLLGSYILFTVKPDWIKFWTYGALLPLILLQAAGVRRPIRAEASAGVPFGVAVGTLYSVTTISGPPLAVMLNNQGFAKQEFRAALGVIRVTECVLTMIVYARLGLFSRASASLLFWIVPSALIGIPLGSWLIRRLEAETFRRICMSFDAWIVAFGLSKVTASLGLAASPAAYWIMALVGAVDCALLYKFFARLPRPAPQR